MKNQHCLFIHYYFPPIHSIGSLRNYHLAECFSKSLGKCWIITTSNKNRFNKTSDSALFKGQIHAIPTFDYRTLISYFKQDVHFSEGKKRGLSKFIIRLNLSFPFNLLWGEGGALYILLAFLRGYKLIRKHEIKFMFSSFMPYSDHFVAFLLKKCFPHLVWVADFRDLHINPSRKNLLFYRFQQWCNRQILNQAYLVSTVSEGLANHLSGFHPKVKVLYNGIDRQLLYDRTIALKSDIFTITYTGSIYEGLQDPSPLLQIIQELIQEKKINAKEIRIVYAGKDSQKWKAWVKQFNLSAQFFDCGLISRTKVIELQRTSNINLVLSWSNELIRGILTAKLFEYLAAGSPVVALINGSGKDADWEHLFKKTKGGKVFYEDSNQALKSHILQLFLDWKTNGWVQKNPNTELVKAYFWEALTDQFIQQNLDDVLNDKPHKSQE